MTTATNSKRKPQVRVRFTFPMRGGEFAQITYAGKRCRALLLTHDEACELFAALQALRLPPPLFARSP